MKKLPLFLVLLGLPFAVTHVQAANFAGQDALCQDPAFVARVRQAIVQGALAAQNELDGVPNHLERANYARSVLLEPARHANIMCHGVVAGRPGLIEANSTDDQIYDAAVTIWNAYAMVDPL